MNIKYYLFAVIIAVFSSCAHNIDVSSYSKREFRGAWIQAVNGQWEGLSESAMKKELTRHLDALEECNANVVFFQVRVECDALYNSPYEPWSRFLSGRQGVNPGWDPLAWMIVECHKRGMELHAWINPFRAKTAKTDRLSNRHIAITNPERIIKYEKLYLLNPGQPENREYICKIASDIVRRYDVDGLHIDDYFYPYPVAGYTINDNKEFERYNNGIRNKNDWRRDNVNVFIKQLSDSIRNVKPWVKFGVSPFGIYRNKRNDSNGSNTNGLQNYDDLYADVLLWVNNGWIDYNIPQLYWEIGHKSADYATLIEWWNKNAANRPLIIGEDITRTVKAADLKNPRINQMPEKYRLHSIYSNVKGTCLWYSRVLADNLGNYANVLRDAYWSIPALQPSMPFISKKAPSKPRKAKAVKIDGKNVLFWTEPKGSNWQNTATKYAIYQYDKDKNVYNPIGYTTNTFFELPVGESNSTYVVTSLNRIDNESNGAKIKVK